MLAQQIVNHTIGLFSELLVINGRQEHFHVIFDMMFFVHKCSFVQYVDKTRHFANTCWS